MWWKAEVYGYLDGEEICLELKIEADSYDEAYEIANREAIEEGLFFPKDNLFVEKYEE